MSIQLLNISAVPVKVNLSKLSDKQVRVQVKIAESDVFKGSIMINPSLQDIARRLFLGHLNVPHVRFGHILSLTI